MNIVQMAVQSGQFNTLVQAVQAAGLLDTLSGEGPFTVFAPTDEAFEKLPAGTVQKLLKDIPKLQSVLTYHVVPDKMMASDVSQRQELTTVEGHSLHVDTTRGVMVENAHVVQADLSADNGVIHVIDEVMIPS